MCHFWLQKNKMATVKNQNAKLKASKQLSPQISGWRHGDYVHFLYTVYDHNSRIEEEIVTIFNIWSDNELVTLILGAHLETVVIE